MASWHFYMEYCTILWFLKFHVAQFKQYNAACARWNRLANAQFEHGWRGVRLSQGPRLLTSWYLHIWTFRRIILNSLDNDFLRTEIDIVNFRGERSICWDSRHSARVSEQHTSGSVQFHCDQLPGTGPHSIRQHFALGACTQGNYLFSPT